MEGWGCHRNWNGPLQLSSENTCTLSVSAATKGAARASKAADENFMAGERDMVSVADLFRDEVVMKWWMASL
jgi:hypothetical protein